MPSVFLFVFWRLLRKYSCYKEINLLRSTGKVSNVKASSADSCASSRVALKKVELWLQHAVLLSHIKDLIFCRLNLYHATPAAHRYVWLCFSKRWMRVGGKRGMEVNDDSKQETLNWWQNELLTFLFSETMDSSQGDIQTEYFWKTKIWTSIS